MKNFFKLLLGGVFVASLSWGGVVACATTGPGLTLGDATFAPTDVGNGCASVNVSFTNVSLSAPVASGTGVAETSSNNAIYATGTGVSGDNVGPVTATFDPTTASNWSMNSGATSTTGATDSYVAVANTGGSYTGGTYPTPTTPGNIWAFNDITLEASGSLTASKPGSQAQVVMTICIDATTTVGCAAADTATITATLSGSGNESTFGFQCSVGAGFTAAWGNCAGGSSNATNVSLTVSEPTQVAISDVYIVDRVNGTGATVVLNDFQNIFGEMDPPAPEPSTFVLLGSALAGLAFLSRRRKA
jgi:hypothetical protein